MSTNIRYLEIDPTAAADASVSAPAGFAHNDDGVIYGDAMKPYITLEQHSWALNGTREVMQATDAVAWWDDDLSGADGTIASPPTLTITFSQSHSSVGISLEFDTALKEWCSEVNLKWYNGSTLLADEDFEPDAPLYFCEQSVTAFNKVMLTLNKTDKPYRRAKLNRIVFGLIRDFSMEQVKEGKITAQCHLVSAELPISKFSWTLIDDESVENMFMFKQPVEITNSGNLLGVYYIDETRKKARNMYDLECIDAIGILDTSNYAGAYYSSNTSAQTMVTNVLGGEFDVTFEATDVSLKGIVPAGTKRHALQQILFAWGAVATTDGVRGIRIFDLPASGETKPTEEIYTEGTIEKTAIVTQINITTHSFSQSSSGDIDIGGTKYKDTTSVYTWNNPDAAPTDKPNVINVTDAWLVNSNNAATVAARLAAYYAMRDTSKAKMVWTGEKLGDKLTIDNSWSDPKTGYVRVMEMILSNVIAAQTEVQG